MTSTIQFVSATRQFLDIAMQHSLHERARFAKSTGLSMPQFGILAQLHFRGVCGMSEVSERFEITPAAAIQLVVKLVLGGLIQLDEDPHDRRAKCLKLTDKGKALMQRNIEERYRWVDELAGKLSADERAKVTEALDIINKAVKELETEPSSHPSRNPQIIHN